MSDCEVVLDGGRPWGIRLQGGADYDTPLKIAQVTPDSKADLKGLLADTQVLAINGNKTEYLTMVQAQNLIKMSGDQLILHLKSHNEGCIKYVVMEGGRPWGIRLQGGMTSGLQLKIGQVTEGSKASNMGLTVGDEIHSINDEPTEQLTMLDAQNLIKETGNELKLGIIHACDASDNVTKRSDNGNQSSKTDEGDDSFFEELRKSMGSNDETSRRTEAKGNTFKSLQEHTDAGLGKSVRTVFDVAASERNKSIPILAPRVQESNEGDDTTNSDQGRAFTMVGGKPWGIRLQGGKNTGSPLMIAQVTPSSKAFQVGLLVGDHVISINNCDSNELTMMDAQNLIKETGDKLKLCIKQESTEKAAKHVDKEVDDAFFEDLKISMKGCKDDRGGRDVKGNAFKMLQNIVDSGTIK